MAIVYCCWTTGNDTTGDGAYGTPYKTITKASTGLTGGDEVRVSKSPAHTALTGTLTWADNSASVATSADLTGELAAGDMIGKDADDDMWWEVTSLNSTTITLRHVYAGTSEAVASYKMGFHDLGSPASTWTYIETISASGSSVSSLLKISGGWDLSTQTQTAWSFFCTTDATNRNGYSLYHYGKSYFEVSKISFARVGRVFSFAGGSNNRLVDIHGYSFGTTNHIDITDVDCLLQRVRISGYSSDYTTINSGLSGLRLTIDDCAILSMGGTASTVLNPVGSQSIIKKLTLRCCLGTAVVHTNRSLCNEIIVAKCTTAISMNDTYGEQVARIGKLTISDCTTAISWPSSSGGPVYIGSFIPDATNDYDFSSFYNIDSPWPILMVQRWQDTAGDSRMIYYHGIVYRDTTDARSGACLKATPTSATSAMWISLGKHRVTSVAADIVLSVYAKDNATFNGDVSLMALMNGQVVSDLWVAKTMDTTYGQHSLTVDTLDLVNGEWLELVARVRGTAGSVFFDDFAAAAV